MIIDDDEMSRKTLSLLVSQAEDLELEDTCNNAIEAISILNSKKIDLLLLDIEMPGISGPQLLKSLHKPPLVIVVSANKEYALQAFEWNVVDYLVKPITPDRFYKSVAKAKEVIDQAKNEIEFLSKDYIRIKDNGKQIQLALKDILFFEASHESVNIITTDKEYSANSNFNFLEHHLDPDSFLRVHRSFIINLQYISNINEQKVIVGQQVIPISPEYKANFSKRLNLLK
ncbi:MAG TPA: LytTR family DNA-binding domain-containing protein [Bacteroidia bacterium]|jgi:DNA-binding LytR/AlgR family response regulator|nr:LytTR family DNA-binding domain-containing protein [Bacteroidia bacterium]